MERREFLRALGATGAAAALTPLSAISLEDDWYVNSRIGLALRKPPGWHFVSVVDFERLMDEQQNEFEEDRDLLRKIREISNKPILVINKYDPAPDDAICPTIQIHASPLEDDPDAPDLEIAAVLANLEAREWFRDYESESAPRRDRIGDWPAWSWNYTYRLGPGDGMAGPAEGSDCCDEDFAAVKASIEIL